MPRKIKATVVQNGIDKEIEVEVPDGPPVAWQKPSEMRILNKEIRRIDGPAKVTGRARYTYDVNLPGMLHAAVVRCPHAHARITTIDTKPAEKLPGVKAVLVVQDIGAEIFWAGDDVVAVAAVDEHTAEAA